MYNKNSKLAVGLAIIFEILSIFYIRKEMYLTIITIILIAFPFFITHIANNNKIKLPYNFQLTLVIFIFAAMYLGEINNFYDKFWWWDLMLHIIFGFYVVVISFFIMEGIIKQDTDSNQKKYLKTTSIFAFSIAIAMGTLWEIFEFSGDFLFNTGMVKGDLEDTMTDLIVKVTSAFIASIFYYFHNKKK